MHFLIDYKGTLDTGGQDEWRALINLMKENGHSVSVATSGAFGKTEEKTCGFKASDFDKVYQYEMKSPHFIEKVAKDFNAEVKDICIIDNDDNLIELFRMSNMNSILHRTISSTKEQLIERKFLS